MSTQKSVDYDEYGINKTYDSQDSYTRRQSCYGNGKYPPDWAARREAVWERQRFQCGRCGVYKGDSSYNAVHHVVHLQHGGSNALDNLVGLCGDCHALMHPDVDALDGRVTGADVFPGEYSDDRVAVVRKPEGDDTLKFDVERLSELSSPDTNTNAITTAAVQTSADTARRAEQSLQSLLLTNGFVPRTSDYHRVRVRATPSGLLSAISPRSVTVDARGDGQTMEQDEIDDGTTDLYYSADSSAATVEIEDPTGETETEHLPLDHRSGSRWRVEKPLSAPALTPRTLPEYGVGALRYFGWNPLKAGLVPGLILAVLLSVLLPDGVSVAAIVGVVFLTGLLRRAPQFHSDVLAPSAETVVDERSASD